MKAAMRFVALAAAMALGTWMVAWWTLPVVAAVWGYVMRDDASAPVAAGLAAMLSWAALMMIAARGAPDGSVMDAVGAAMQVGPGALVALTLAFAALLAASAAGLVRAVAGTR